MRLGLQRNECSHGWKPPPPLAKHPKNLQVQLQKQTTRTRSPQEQNVLLQSLSHRPCADCRKNFLLFAQMNYKLTQPLKGSESHFPLSRYVSLVIKTTWLICSMKLFCRVGKSPPTRFMFHALICGVPRRSCVFPFQKFALVGNKARPHFQIPAFVPEPSHLHTWGLSPASQSLRA